MHKICRRRSLEKKGQQQTGRITSALKKGRCYVPHIKKKIYKEAFSNIKKPYIMPYQYRSTPQPELSPASSDLSFPSAPSTPDLPMIPDFPSSRGQNQHLIDDIIVDSYSDTVDYVAQQAAIVLRRQEFNPWGFHSESLLQSAALAGATLFTQDYNLRKRFELKILHCLRKHNKRQCPNCHYLFGCPNTMKRHMVQKRCPAFKQKPNQHVFCIATAQKSGFLVRRPPI